MNSDGRVRVAGDGGRRSSARSTCRNPPTIGRSRPCSRCSSAWRSLRSAGDRLAAHLHALAADGASQPHTSRAQTASADAVAACSARRRAAGWACARRCGGVGAGARLPRCASSCSATAARGARGRRGVRAQLEVAARARLYAAEIELRAPADGARRRFLPRFASAAGARGRATTSQPRRRGRRAPALRRRPGCSRRDDGCEHHRGPPRGRRAPDAGDAVRRGAGGGGGGRGGGRARRGDLARRRRLAPAARGRPVQGRGADRGARRRTPENVPARSSARRRRRRLPAAAARHLRRLLARTDHGGIELASMGDVRGRTRAPPRTRAPLAESDAAGWALRRTRGFAR